MTETLLLGGVSVELYNKQIQQIHQEMIWNYDAKMDQATARKKAILLASVLTQCVWKDYFLATTFEERATISDKADQWNAAHSSATEDDRWEGLKSLLHIESENLHMEGEIEEDPNIMRLSDAYNNLSAAI